MLEMLNIIILNIQNNQKISDFAHKGNHRDWKENLHKIKIHYWGSACGYQHQKAEVRIQSLAKFNTLHVFAVNGS